MAYWQCEKIVSKKKNIQDKKGPRPLQNNILLLRHKQYTKYYCSVKCQAQTKYYIYIFEQHNAKNDLVSIFLSNIAGGKKKKNCTAGLKKSKPHTTYPSAVSDLEEQLLGYLLKVRRLCRLTQNKKTDDCVRIILNVTFSCTSIILEIQH